MRSRWLVLLLFTSFCYAQDKAPAAQNTPSDNKRTGAGKAQVAPKGTGPAIEKAEPVDQTVPEDAPVMTIQGLCEDIAPNTADCKTVVTRRQFENILSAVAPSRAGSPAELPPGVKRNMATQYAQLLTVATDAEKQGVEKTPEAQELLKFARMQAIVQAYTRELQKKLEPTDAEIQSFYNASVDKLQQATLERIFIPKAANEPANPEAKAPSQPGQAGKPASGTAEKAKADAIRQRAVAGEPFEKLQKEAIAGSKLPTAPETKLTVQKDTLPPSQQSVFELKPGQVSQVFVEPSGFYIYKMVAVQPVPLSEVKMDIRQRLLQEKMQTALESMLKNVKPVFNEQYFGPPPAVQTPGGASAAPSGPAVPKPQSAPQSTKPDSK